jgi:hypothetical protein
MSKSNDELDSNKIFNFDFYINLFNSKGKNLKGEAEKPNEWTKFFMGCGVSVIGVLILGAVGANFIYYSKLNTDDPTGDDTDESLGTYFPIPKDLNYGVFAGNESTDFGPYESGTDATDVKAGSISLSLFNIPPTGTDSKWMGRWPYSDEMFDDYSDRPNTFFDLKKKKMWIIRTITATYIFWRAILQYIFKAMKYCPGGFKLFLSLIILGVFIFGPGFLVSLVSDNTKIASGGFIGLIVASFYLMSILQIRWEWVYGLGKIWHLVFSIVDMAILSVIGSFMAIAFTIQFILTFIPPFGPFLFNFMGAMEAMHDIKDSLGILYGFFIFGLAKQYLNNAILSGMTLIVAGYILVNINIFRRNVYDWIHSSKKK